MSEKNFTLKDLMPFINYWQELLIVEIAPTDLGYQAPVKNKRLFADDLLITRATLENNFKDEYEELKERELAHGIHAHQFRPDLLVITLKKAKE